MNRTILVGRITADPELRTTPNGIANTTITVAVNRYTQNGEQTDFIRCVVWRRQAENVAKYCTKGSLIALEGRISSRSYDAQDGTRRYVTEVVADNVRFLGSRSGASSNAGTASAYEPVQETSTTPAQAFESPATTANDDIPFPEGETVDLQTNIGAESNDPFASFGSEIALSDDDLPF